ncbi:putative HTH-type transcriptional regulator IscR [Selenomonas sp. oral taxon 892 str. F0426]|uniref:RrF2 family transcriptional regulator n=1 Tax=Selenomonas sp. oral taxon 892 TaxID=1321785 RepID=UPI0003AD23B0|nr:Rrf2 family transcriptional regulator [Selenomonas sp. oral taxon 892]ERJ95475.1 putative HTH-type transcriptional regulator IscR [Selenomonas sp. oral taxon 892 str. F0426]
MKLSTKGRYSVTALYELALHYGEGVVPLKTIAKTQGISENYLEQLMAPLRRAGLVESVRGAQGGYTLARAPEDVTIGRIITAVEGPIALVDCVLASAEADDQSCVRAGSCVTRQIWVEVCDSMNAVLNNISLADLVQRNRHRIGCNQ